jgi:hypothetical protein
MLNWKAQLNPLESPKHPINPRRLRRAMMTRLNWRIIKTPNLEEGAPKKRTLLILQTTIVTVATPKSPKAKRQRKTTRRNRVVRNENPGRRQTDNSKTTSQNSNLRR